MGIMSNLDIMFREGDREIEDFVTRGYDPETAAAFASIIADVEKGRAETQRIRDKLRESTRHLAKRQGNGQD